MGWEWPWRTAATRRAAERQAYLDALQAVVDIARAHAAASEALATAIDSWAKPWQAGATVTNRRWVNSDLSEWLKENEGSPAMAGFPSHLSQADQLDWVARQMDFDPLATTF